MNTYYLKRIRRRYKYYWDTPAIEAPTLWVLDMKNQEVFQFSSIRNFMRAYLNEHVGFYSCLAYNKRVNRRKSRRQFQAHLRNVSPHFKSPNTTP
jgi:hypothetical protein